MSQLVSLIEQTSLYDLPLNVLQRVAWERLEIEAFRDELNNIDLLRRIGYVDKSEGKVFKFFLENYIYIFDEKQIAFMLDVMHTNNNHKTLGVITGMFNGETQFSIGFLELYSEHVPMYYIEHQNSITPEFYDTHSESMDHDAFWANFGSLHSHNLLEWVKYKNGKFLDHIIQTGIVGLTESKLVEAGITVPMYYSTVMTEQRVMSGRPCEDGQRSFRIWLRKYRRVYNNPEGYPTWSELMDLYDKHPRMNHDGYIDWLYSRALRNTPEEVSQYPEHLEVQAKDISDNMYSHEVQDTSDEPPETQAASSTVEPPARPDRGDVVARNVPDADMQRYVNEMQNIHEYVFHEEPQYEPLDSEDGE